MTNVLHWSALPTLPDPDGFAGSYAGESRGALLVAGGTNFPDQPPWAGGTKVWYDRVFALEHDSKSWQDAGRLPVASGYGVSVSVDDGVVLVGGGDAKRNFDSVWLARWNGQRVGFEAWPSLPVPLAMASGALVGRTIYIAGGIDQPDAARAQPGIFALEVDHLEKGWREIPACPGAPRILAITGALGDSFYLFGGAVLIPDTNKKPQRGWLRDAWRYSSKTGWQRLADLPRPVVAAPSPAPTVMGDRLLVIGGDDGTQVSVAPGQHRGFPRQILSYQPLSDTWTQLGQAPFSLVTTPAVVWRGRLVIPGGEARPGVRSPNVWLATVDETGEKK